MRVSTSRGLLGFCSSAITVQGRTGSKRWVLTVELVLAPGEYMANPVVVEAMRGDRIESTHRGAGAVVAADGRVVMAFGDAEQAVYPRSAVKALRTAWVSATRRLRSAARLTREARTMSRPRAECSRKLDTMNARSNAARIGRLARMKPARLRAQDGRRPLCTTIAPANTRASSVFPARWESILRGMSRRITRCSARLRRRSRR